MKKPTKETVKKNLSYNKIESKAFLEKGLDSIAITGTILRRQYICNNSDNEVYLTVTTNGDSVVLGNTQYKLDGKIHEISGDEKQNLGKNGEIDGKKLKIVRTVSGNEGTSCITSVWIEGGYKDIVYRLSSEIDSSSYTTFIIYIEFI